MLPKVYRDYPYIIEMCREIQEFFEQDNKTFLVLNLPPRHLKSITGQLLACWLLGKGASLGDYYKLITASYNEKLSTTFARNVRNFIQTEKVSENQIVFGDIFPECRIKPGEASASMWAVEGSTESNYLATSPGGTLTGFGANKAILIDDIIKNAEEAYNQNKLEQDWSWFTDTLLSRMERGCKIILIMTRWSSLDLAGQVIRSFGDRVKKIEYHAVQDDGSMLCPEILTREEYELKTQFMDKMIAEANYNQVLIDRADLLYHGFNTYDKSKKVDKLPVYVYVDTADTGSDYLNAIFYSLLEGQVLVKHIIHTDEPMEITEELVANAVQDYNCQICRIESNNGGRGFARSVKKILADRGFVSCRFVAKAQSKNKETRINHSASWVAQNVIMPSGWRERFKLFANEVLNYSRKMKNLHDDGVDNLANLAELHRTDEKGSVGDLINPREAERLLKVDKDHNIPAVDMDKYLNNATTYRSPEGF
jgi:predicted phage terminase large subunit-like protein